MIRPVLALGMLLAGFGFLALQFSSTANAASLKDLENQLKQAELDAKKYRELQQQEKQKADVFKSEIDRTQKEIAKVQAELALTQREIRDKESNILTTSNEINLKTQELERLESNQDSTLVTLYEMGGASISDILLSSDSLSSYDDHLTYLQSFGDYIADVFNQVDFAKKELEDHRASLEAKRRELAVLKGEQESERQTLQVSKNQKDKLLAQAQTSEKNYDSLADAAEEKKRKFNAELAKFIRSGGIFISKGPVKKGDIIGYMGSSGFSTGPHVHFETIKNGSFQNPRAVVSSGELVWPLDPFHVTQEFGGNWKTRSGRWAYSNGHTGIDIVSADGYGAAVRASGDGTIIERPGGRYNSGGYGYYTIIDHGNGLLTLYGHLTS